jgi:Beta-lactamase enzyme family
MQKLTFFLSLIAFAWVTSSSTCKHSFDLEKAILQDPLLKHIHEHKDEYEVQIRYTQIDRDSKGKPRFTSYDYNVDSLYYFYPASTIKMPIAMLALEKIRALAKQTGKPLDLYTPMYHFGARPPQSDYVLDETTGQVPCISDYVDEIFAVSDNNASNRLFEFMGAEYINNELYKIGAFTTSHIVNRVGISGFDHEDNCYVNEVQFKDRKRNLLHAIPARKSVFIPKVAIKGQKKGIGYIDGNDSLVMQPFDFSQKNYFSIIDLEACLKRVLFPEAFPVSQRFDLEKEDYTFLRKSMSRLPRDLSYYKGDSHYYDTYVKFFFDGDSTSTIPPHVKIYNKVGWAYGYLTDCSYYTDEAAGVEFLLTATIKVNKDGIFNDGKYEYDTEGLPFFRALGRAILNYESTRRQKH